MAGSNADFNPTLFRSQIVATMQMATPSDSALAATFRWTTTNDYAKEDAAGEPFDWTATPTTSTSHDDVQVAVAVEFSRTYETANTPVGSFDMSRAVITVLDEQYADIEGADQVVLGGNLYNIDFWEPPIGLFEVTVYRAHVKSVDET